jgi:hypothetical protein
MTLGVLHALPGDTRRGIQFRVAKYDYSTRRPDGRTVGQCNVLLLCGRPLAARCSIMRLLTIKSR